MDQKRALETNSEDISTYLHWRSKYDFMRYGEDMELVSFAYMPPVNISGQGDGTIELSWLEKKTPDFKFWTELYQLFEERLEKIKSADKDYDFKFKMNLLNFNIDPSRVNISEGFKSLPILYVSAGVKVYDSVDSMYAANEIGVDILKKGLEHKRRPVWSRFKYNFMQLKGIGADPRINNPSLEKFLDELEAEKVAV